MDSIVQSPSPGSAQIEKFHDGLRNVLNNSSPAYNPMMSVSSSSDELTPVSSRCVSPVNNTASLEITLKEKVRMRIESGDKFFSLEFFPPRMKSGAINLLARLERMGMGHPLFIDITWHSAGNHSGESETSSTMIAHSALQYVGLETMLHMTCLGCSSDTLSAWLDKAKHLGIRNILALRGDTPSGTSTDGQIGCQYGVDLVRHIRRNCSDDFTVVVAGYPCGHPDAVSYEDDLLHLKDKVVAGADFIITQLFFKASTFKKFVDDCRAVGISCPIIPGIMPIQSYVSLKHIVKLTKLEVPKEILTIVEPLRGNDDAIRSYGIDQAVNMMKDLFISGYANAVHIYTLNREVAAICILKRLGLWKQDPAKPLPFKLAANPKRCNEEVRPIFWRRHSRTYIYRTRHWDEFPNGRWGNSASPAFGELKDYYLFFLANRTSEIELLKMWGAPTTEQDVWNVFTCYLTGEANADGVQVTQTIFNEDPLDAETELIADKLAEVNKKGVLTVNSQPSVNCAPSSDPRVGWGPSDGYVFQKAYLEFFASKDFVVALLQVLRRYPLVNFQVINHDGSFNCTNVDKLRPIAVTWGVFPGCEIKQPTVVDAISFHVWREEVFALWNERWGKFYETGSPSAQIIESISTSYLLVNLVDNNFPMGNCLWSLLDDAFNRKVLNDRIANSRSINEIVDDLSYVHIVKKTCKDR